MNIFIVLLTILFIISIGFCILQGFNFFSKKEKLISLPYSFGLGVGLISTQLYLYSRLNIPWSRLFVILPWVILIAVIVFRKKNDIHFKFPSKSYNFPRLQKTEILLLIGIIFSVSYTTFEALLRPASVWDSWATWLLESKIFFIDGKINPDIFNYLGSTYPLVYKLLGTFTYIMLGQVDDTAVLFMSTAFYILLAVLFFCMLRKKYTLLYSLLFTFLLVSTQNLIRHGGRIEAGIADLPLAYYSFICFTLLADYLKKSSSRTFLLLNIFLGITQLIKVEGTFFVLIVEAIIFVHMYNKKLYKQLWILLFWLIPLIDWQVYRKINHLDKNYFTVFPFGFSFEKTIHSIVGTVKELINIKSWNLLWILYFYSLFCFGINKNKELFLLNILILSQLTIYMLIYIFSLGNGPESSIERLLLHVAPLALYSIAIGIKIQKYTPPQQLEKLKVKLRS
jgi:hypothetical protein